MKKLLGCLLAGVALTSWAGELVTDDLTAFGTANFYGDVHIGVGLEALPTNGLALYYSFDTNTAVVADLSGNNRTGTVTGATWTPSGKAGGAYAFDGNDYITAGDTLDLTGSVTDLTVCAWIKTANGSGQPHIVGKNQTPSPYTGWSLSFDVNKTLNVSLIAQYPQHAETHGSVTLTNDQWRFVCGTLRKGASSLLVKSYADATVDQTASYSGALGSSDTSAPLTIGARDGGTQQFFNGLIDEVLIYTRILSDAEIQAIYAYYEGLNGSLNVNGLIANNQLIQTSATGTNILMGTTGIGTTHPLAPLHVAGAMQVDGNIRLGEHWLSGDGDPEGVTVASDGAVTIPKLAPQGDLSMGTFTNMP